MPTATKTQRTLSYNRLTGILHVTDARSEKGYYVDRLASEYGAAYRLTKLIRKAGEPDHYDVCLDGDEATCECLGHLKHGHKTVCRHVAALRCLRQRGSIA